ncbi:MAG: hypothetical protein LBF85_01365 [Tannerella sp.]|jgi:hypothetical protein|nr:hypothetical protein [Tannerella sp.]
MKIRYYLLDNPITPDPDDRKAQISGYEVVTEKVDPPVSLPLPVRVMCTAGAGHVHSK